MKNDFHFKKCQLLRKNAHLEFVESIKFHFLMKLQNFAFTLLDTSFIQPLQGMSV